MKVLLNLIWLIFGGLWLALGYGSRRSGETSLTSTTPAVWGTRPQVVVPTDPS